MEKDLDFLSAASYAASFGTCLSRKVGAVLVVDNKIVSVAYAGAANNYKNCETCYRKENNVPSGTMLDKCYSVHAEQRIIFDALKKGIDLTNSVLYINCTPCITCAKFIVHLGIKRVVTSSYYPDEFALNFIKSTNLKLDIIEKELPSTKQEYIDYIDLHLKENKIETLV